MPRVIVCDRCGASTKNDCGRVHIFKHRCKWARFDVEVLVGNNWDVYLCNDCAKAFKVWMKKEGVT